MKTQILCCCIAIMLWTAPVVSAQSKWKVPDNMKQLTGYIKVPVFADVKDEPGLPRVLIIGDSISMYYTPEVRRLLAEAGRIRLRSERLKKLPCQSASSTSGGF